MDTQSSSDAKSDLSLAELVGFVAAVMALSALAIDIMLPALGQIGDALGAPRDNDRQLIIVVYILANGVAQLFCGPLVDALGRKRVLMFSLGGYVLGSLFSVLASSFTLLLAARAFQGIATAGARVAITAAVRDQCSGRKMAQVMSLAVTIFMAAPILAPGLGQLILFAAPWRGIFVALLVYGLILAIWVHWRLPETLTPDRRHALRFGPVFSSYTEFCQNRIALGYSMASAFFFGTLYAYIAASEQIFLETFAIGPAFVIAFAVIAAALAVASLLNARLVATVGMRRLTHSAALVFVIANMFHLAIVAIGGDNLSLFMIFMSISFFCMGLLVPNMTAMALEPMGHIAGAAAAANGFAGTTIAAFFAGIVARFYDGTTLPLIEGFTFLGLAAFAVILWAEKGRLFHPREEEEAS